MKKKNIQYILLFFYFLFLLWLSPISGDDWGNYLQGSQGFIHIFVHALGMYFNWESRIISRILINFFTYHKMLWNIFNSFSITMIIFLIMKIINPKNKNIIFPLVFLLILCMNIFTFSQVVVWVAGNLTYLTAIPILLYYFYQINNKKNTFKNILFSILNIIIPLFVENIAVVLVFGNLLILIDNYLKNKKIKKNLICYFLCSIIGISLVLLSPGSMKRNAIENPLFNQLNLMEKIGYNLPNFIHYTYIVNPYLIFLMFLGITLLLTAKKNSYNKTKKIGIIFMIPSIIFSIIYLLENVSTLTIINLNNMFVIFYFIIYTIFHLILLLKESQQTNDKRIVFFYLLGIMSNLVMLISPTWGYRTSFATYIFLSISYLIMIDNYIKNKKIYCHLFTGIMMIMISFYSILYISVARQNIDNVHIIQEQKKMKLSTIKIIRYPSFVNCNINPEDDYHIETFKKYYQIDPKTKIELIDNNWKYFIFYRKTKI